MHGIGVNIEWPLWWSMLIDSSSTAVLVGLTKKTGLREFEKMVLLWWWFLFV